MIIFKAIRMEKILFIALLSASFASYVEAAPHSHGDRAHNHALPTAGIQHQHGGGEVGQQPAASGQKNPVEATKNGDYYYNLSRKKTLGSTEQIQLLQKACNMNHVIACSKLGIRYYKGVGGVLKNEVKGVQLFKKSCDLNYGTGCTLYSQAFHEGKGGVQVNHQKRDSLLEKACRLGDESTCDLLLLM